MIKFWIVNRLFPKLSPKGKPLTKEDVEEHNCTLAVSQDSISWNKEEPERCTEPRPSLHWIILP